MKLNIDNNVYEVSIIKKNIKHMYFKWSGDILVVSSPKYISDKQINEVINKNIESIKALKSRTPKTDLKENEMYYLGDKYIKCMDNKSKAHIDGNTFYYKDEKEYEKFVKKESLRIFKSELDRLKPLFPYLPEFTLKVRKMSSRWGVCNKKSMTVTLNTELLKKDVSLIDYVIVHELCHFKYMDHSKNFWNEVGKYYPYYKQARKLLKESQND